MRLLAIDTTSEYGGAAVFDQKECLAIALNSEPASRYAVTLFELADRALSQARMGFPDIDLFAVCNGPGSFTGIRVGLAAVQGWARAFRSPAKGVNLLEAMVEQAHPNADWAVPVVDARRGEFFAGFYRRTVEPGGTQSCLEAGGLGQLVRPERFQAMLDALRQGGQCRTFMGGTIAFITRAHDLKARSLREGLPHDLLGIEVPGVLLEAIAKVALRACEQGEKPSSDDLDACYIRHSDAEMKWRAPAAKAGS